MRNDKIKYIEDTLSDYMTNYGSNKYTELVNNNTILKKYVDIISKIDSNDYPSNYIHIVTDEDLDNIIEYIKKAID